VKFKGADRYLRQLQYSLDAIRLGVVFVRAGSFKMPHNVRVAGKSVRLHYPPDQGAANDFMACCIRNDYGLGRQLKNVETILDVGANVGFFSIAARARYPHAQIHAYEPNPRVLSFLKSNTAEIGISVFPEAVGASAGRVSILDNGDSNQATTQAASDGAIPQVSLETAIERLGGTVDLLKLDCEGAEWEMFGVTRPWDHVRNIRMEYHLVRDRTIQDVDQALERVGFRSIRWRCSLGFGIVWTKRP
jgi:FkbM family methyltransferase